MRVVSKLEISLQVIEKNGLHYAMVWDVDTNNLIYEQDFVTRKGAETALANFVIETLGAQ
jgi:hypothetical protein